MHAEDRRAFDTILAEIFGAIDKPFTEASKEGFWKGLQRMSIVEFSRCRDLLFEDLQKGERPRNFSVANVWMLKGRMRASGPELRIIDGWQGDDWDIRANMRLLSRVLKAGTKRMVYTPEQTRALVAMKNHWAEVMRKSGDPSLQEQNEFWDSCLRQAESDFSRAAA